MESGTKRSQSDTDVCLPDCTRSKRSHTAHCQPENPSNMNSIPDELMESVLQFVDYFKQRQIRCVSKRWNSILRSQKVSAIALMDVYSVYDVVTQGRSTDSWNCSPKEALFYFKEPAVRTIIYDAKIRSSLPEKNDSDEGTNDHDYDEQFEHREYWFRFLKSVFRRCPNLERLVVFNAENCFQEIDTKAHPLSASLIVLKSFGERNLQYPVPTVPVQGWRDAKCQNIPIIFRVPYAEIKAGEDWAKQEINHAWPYGGEQLVWLSSCVSQLIADSCWQMWLNKFHFRGLYGQRQRSRPPTDSEIERAFGKEDGSSNGFLQSLDWLDSLDRLTLSAYILARRDVSVERPPQKFDFETQEFNKLCEEANVNLSKKT